MAKKSELQVEKKVGPVKAEPAKPSKTSEVGIFAMGGKQFVAPVGQELLVEKLTTEIGKTEKVKDLITGKTITLTVLGQKPGVKIRIWKFKNKTRSLRRKGHRQKYTQVKVESIA